LHINRERYFRWPPNLSANDVLLMTRFLQIITVLVFIGIMYAIHQGAYAAIRMMDGNFLSGLLVGVLGMCFFFLFANWLDKKLPTNRRRE
jgi:hypothetical protein